MLNTIIHKVAVVVSARTRVNEMYARNGFKQVAPGTLANQCVAEVADEHGFVQLPGGNYLWTSFTEYASNVEVVEVGR